VLPGAFAWLLLLPLLASAYGFSQVNAKTDDGFFLGFPSYWNIVAFYLYVFHAPIWVSVALIVTLAVLTFVPTPYLYATRGGPFARLINVGAAIWFVLLGLILFGPAHDTLAVVSLIYPLTYMALSAAVTVRRRRAILRP
jgi:phosphatidylcholine synthase